MSSFEFYGHCFDDLTLSGQGWAPEREPHSVVCLVHGLGEHLGRYDYFAGRLCDAGVVVMGFDLRGHGRSEGKRGHSPSFEALMDDIHQLIELASARFPGKPLFLYGHSLGGLLALGYASLRRSHLAGVIVSGPALRSSLEGQKVKVNLARVLSRIIPSASIWSGLDPTTICSDPDVVYAYQCDPLVHNRVSFSMGTSLLNQIDQIFKQAPDFTYPLLIMHGKLDQVAYPSGSEEYAALVEGDCTLRIWEGMYHEIHNEPGKDQVLDFVIEWLNLINAKNRS